MCGYGHIALRFGRGHQYTPRTPRDARNHMIWDRGVLLLSAYQNGLARLSHLTYVALE